MLGLGRRDHLWTGNGDPGPEDDLLEVAAAVGLLDHAAVGVVLVSRDHDAGDRAEAEEPEHVAARQRRDQELLRVVPGRVATEGRVGRGSEHRFAFDADLVGAIVSEYGLGAATPISCPDDGRVVGVLRHGRHCIH